MATQWKGKGRSLTRVAGIGATLALIATGVVAAPAFGTKNPATVTLASSVPGSELETGEAVAFTATVTTGGAPATGTMVFTVTGSTGTAVTCDGGDTQNLATSGGVTTATCSFAKGLPSKPLYYTVTAKLVDPNYKAPTATLTQQIEKSLTNTTISGLPGSVVAGEGFSFTATVQDIAPGTGSPTGSMEFAICQTSSPPPTCTGGAGGTFVLPTPTAFDQKHNLNKITFTLPAGILQPGFYDVSADYVGDSNYWSTQSPFSYLLVTKVPTSLNIVASDNPTYDGGREILRAVLHADTLATASLPGPGGTVTYTITGASGDTLVCQETGTGVIVVGVKAADQGTARCTISGDVHTIDSPYSITAVYSGNSVYDGASGSGTLSVINPPA